MDKLLIDWWKVEVVFSNCCLSLTIFSCENQEGGQKRDDRTIRRRAERRSEERRSEGEQKEDQKESRRKRSEGKMIRRSEGEQEKEIRRTDDQTNGFQSKERTSNEDISWQRRRDAE